MNGKCPYSGNYIGSSPPLYSSTFKENIWFAGSSTIFSAFTVRLTQWGTLPLFPLLRFATEFERYADDHIIYRSNNLISGLVPYGELTNTCSLHYAQKRKSSLSTCSPILTFKSGVWWRWKIHVVAPHDHGVPWYGVLQKTFPQRSKVVELNEYRVDACYHLDFAAYRSHGLDLNTLSSPRHGRSPLIKDISISGMGSLCIPTLLQSEMIPKTGSEDHVHSMKG